MKNSQKTALGILPLLAVAACSPSVEEKRPLFSEEEEAAMIERASKRVSEKFNQSRGRIRDTLKARPFNHRCMPISQIEERIEMALSPVDYQQDVSVLNIANPLKDGITIKVDDYNTGDWDFYKIDPQHNRLIHMFETAACVYLPDRDLKADAKRATALYLKQRKESKKRGKKRR